MNSKKATVTVYTAEYGKLSEVWIHRQVTGAGSVVGNVMARAFEHPDIFPAINPLKIGYKNTWLHRLEHVLRGMRSMRWLTDDDLDTVKAVRLLSNTPCRLLHCHFLTNAALAGSIARELDIPLVVTAHGSDVNRACVDVAYRDTLTDVFAYSTRIIAVSEFIAGVLSTIGCPDDKIQVLPLGAPIPANVAQRGGDDFRWICIASFRPVKGHEHLLRAFAKAREACPGMTLTLVGDGPLRPAMEDLTSTLELNESVSFAGNKTEEEVSQLLLQSQGCVLASIIETSDGILKEEGLPISLVEAAAAGLPLVATNCGGIPEICRDGDNGILIPCEDVTRLAEGMVSLAEDRSKAASMGDASRRLAEHAFNMNTQNQKLVDLYKQLLGSE